MTAVDGRDGSDLFTTLPTATDLLDSSLAAGDLNGDGLVELVAIDHASAVPVAFHHDGSRAWTAAGTEWPKAEAIGVADLDNDGSPEIVFNHCAYSAGGVLRWRGVAARGAYTDADAATSLAVDLLASSPGLELLAGNTAYRADGTIAWNRTDLRDGFSSVGDLDDDGLPEVVLTYGDPSSVKVHVLDRNGDSLAAPLILVGPQRPAPPTLADLDRDGRMEVLLPTDDFLEAFQWTGTQLVHFWTSPPNNNGCCSGVVAFDLDGDGSLEVLFRGNNHFFVIDGMTGDVLAERDDGVESLLQIPVVADIDNDGLPEVVVTSGTLGTGGGGYVTAYECGTPVPTRCIWNQQCYHVTNVNDDGTIPRVEAAPWTVGEASSIQARRHCCASVPIPALPDVLSCEGSSALLDATPVVDPGCQGAATFEWRDGLGAVIGNAATVTVAPLTSETFEVSIDCPGQAPCATQGSVRVIVERRPDLDAASVQARDSAECNSGTLVSWSPATFHGTSGGGTYSIYASDLSCADATARGPVVSGLTATSYVHDVAGGGTYYFVVEAEDDTRGTSCLPPGPFNGGAVTRAAANGGSCVAVVDQVAPQPELLPRIGGTLRLGGTRIDGTRRYSEASVEMEWRADRALDALEGEHFHVHRSNEPGAGFALLTNDAPRLEVEGWVDADADHPNDGATHAWYYLVFSADACDDEDSEFDGGNCGPCPR